MVIRFDATSQRGYLMPIGGAEDKTAKRTILKHFVSLAGGEQARIVVIPSASQMNQLTGERYVTLFKELNAQTVHCIDILDRKQANDPACVQLLDQTTGLFMTGGDQVKLLSLLGGTLLAKKIKVRYESGMTVAGTSAGASAMSQHMIAFGRSGPVPSQRMVQMAAGLGLTESVTIDQHFRQRDRLGRLMTAIAYNPAMLGVGIDEDTAFIIGPDDQCDVLGVGAVTIVDGSTLEYTDAYSVKRHGPIATLGMKVHVLTNGFGYNLEMRQAVRAAVMPETLSGDH